MGSDPGQYIQWIQTKRVHEGPNPYSWETPLSTEDEPDYDGYVPYAIGDPGWGDIKPDTRPEDRYVSIVRNMRSMALADCRMLTQLDAYLRLYIWKPLLTSGYPEDAEFKLGPGAHWEMDPETQHIELLQFGEMPASLLQGMAVVRRYMDEHSKFGALGGTPQRGVDTASEQQNLTQNASSMLSGPINTLRRLAIKINTWVLQDIEYVLECPVNIWGSTRIGPSEVTLTPRDIGGFFANTVSMETADEAQLSMRQALGYAGLYAQIPISAESVLEKAGYDDPQAEMDRRFLEDLDRSPQAMQVYTMAKLEAEAQTVAAAKVVGEAFRTQVMMGDTKPPTGGGTGSAPMPTLQANPIEDFRAQSRDTAIAEQPDLSYS
jgi:hypothetical protein